jgi:predicted PurR-regulated permease PerM
MAARHDPPHEPLSLGFMQRVLFVILMIGMAFLALKLLGLWLLMFGAVVIAVILRGLAEPLMRYGKLKDKPAVAIALIGLIAVIALTVVLFGNQLSLQIDALSREIPQAWAAIHARLDTLPIGQALQKQVDGLGQQAGSLVSFLPGIAGNFLAAAANTFVAMIAGVILAGAPAKYRDGVIYLFPRAMQPALLDSMNTAGEALRKWFIGQFIAMVLVGSLIAIGLSILGVPSALALGLVAGLAQLVPLVGPTVSAGLGLLLAGAGGLQPAIWTFVLYTGVSQLEANIITPMVQRHMTEVPMVLILFALVGFAGLLGPIGVFFAMPLTVIMFTLVKRYLALQEEGKAPKPVD